jgi:hypothetical protein
VTPFTLAAFLALSLLTLPAFADESCPACSKGVVIASDSFDVYHALSNETSIYAAGCEVQRSGSWLVVKRMPVAGGAFETLATLAACDGRWIAIHLDERTLVAAVNGPHQSWLWLIPMGGGDATLLATRANQISHLLADETHFYWLETVDGAGTIHRVSRAGGPVKSVGPAVAGWTDFAIDHDFVYVSADIVGGFPGVYRIDKLSGVTERITTDFAGSLAVDEEHVYWSDGFRVRQMAKGSGHVDVLFEADPWATSIFELRSADKGVLYYDVRGTRGPCPDYSVIVRWTDRESSSLGMIGDVAPGACVLYYATPICWMVPSSSQISRACVTVPRIRELSATMGPDEGGHEIVIRGAHFENVERVSFGGNDATVVSGTSEELRVITPRGGYTVGVRLFTRDGMSTVLDDAYTYDPLVVLRERRPARP